MTDNNDDILKPSRLAVAFGKAAPFAVAAGVMGAGAAVGVAPVLVRAAAVSAAWSRASASSRDHALNGSSFSFRPCQHTLERGVLIFFRVRPPAVAGAPEGCQPLKPSANRRGLFLAPDACTRGSGVDRRAAAS